MKTCSRVLRDQLFSDVITNIDIATNNVWQRVHRSVTDYVWIALDRKHIIWSIKETVREVRYEKL